MLLPENPASRFPFLKIGSHPPSLPTHPLPLAPQDEDGRRQGSLGPKHGERPAGQVHSRASVSPRRVTPAQEAPQPERLPLPRSVAITSCFSSSPTPAPSTTAAASSAGARIPGACGPLPPMCPAARAQLRGPAPSVPRRRGRAQVSRMRSAPRGPGPERC